MTWPEIVEITLDNVAQGGDGVGRWENRVVFAQGGLPGERVRVQLDERKDAYARGSVAEVLEAAPERIAPRDPEADHMPWQHIEYAAQLRFKQQILAEQLAKIGGIDVEVSEIMPASPPWGYRESARVHVQGEELGYFRAGSRELRPFPGDPLLAPGLSEALLALSSLLDEGSQLEEVVLRSSSQEGYIVASLRGKADLKTLAHRWMTRAPQLAGVAHGRGEQGRVEITEELGGITFLLRPEGFFQVNQRSAQVLLDLVRDGLQLSGEERLFDLYCGVGTFALPLARSVARVTGIEESPASVRTAEKTAEANKLENTRFRAGPVERVISDYQHGADALVLDPPRRGCHPRALEEILRLDPRRIVYVSCHPGTLARDLKALVAGGYTVTQVTPVDLFPQTPHIESVSVLEKGR